MPLYAEQGFVLARLYGFDDAVGTQGRDLQMGAWVAHCLMVERVDCQRLFAPEGVLEEASFFEVDGM